MLTKSRPPEPSSAFRGMTPTVSQTNPTDRPTDPLTPDHPRSPLDHPSPPLPPPSRVLNEFTHLEAKVTKTVHAATVSNPILTWANPKKAQEKAQEIRNSFAAEIAKASAELERCAREVRRTGEESGALLKLPNRTDPLLLDDLEAASAVMATLQQGPHATDDWWLPFLPVD